MGTDLMFPTCDKVYRVSPELGGFLNEHMEDFSIRYGYIQQSGEITRHLREVARSGERDAEAARRILQELEGIGAAELFLSY